LTLQSNLLVNTRILHGHLTGVQRYLLSILNHLDADSLSKVSPAGPLHGIKGHAWEQFALPMKCGKKLLWSPSNSGPLACRHQVLTMHDLVPIDHAEFLNPRFASWYQFLLPRLVRRVDRVIAISEFTRNRLIEVFGISEDKIAVVWNGVDDRFKPQSEDKITEARIKLGIPAGRYLVALGSLEPRKNLKRLLQVWSRVVNELPDDVWLVLSGAKGKSLVFDGESYEDLPDRVHLTGHVPDDLLPALYSGALLAPYLSVYEGFGLPPLEAMACGTPPLTGNLTALPEVVGDGGLMVDPYDVDAIASALKKMVVDDALRDNLRLNGFQQARRFDWKRTAEQTMQVLMETA
jgi:glycosyltransferase involved in cell wall biosynthesis